MKLGIGSYTYTWAAGFPGSNVENTIGPLDIMERAIEMGVSIVQFADNMPLHTLPLQTLEELNKKAQNNGITIELGTRGIEHDKLIKYIELAKHLMSPIIRTVTDTEDKQPSVDEIVSSIGKLEHELRHAGIILAVENHDRLSSRCLRRIIEQIGSNYVGICLDTTNSYGALEGIEAVVEQLGPYVVNLHVKDFVIYRCSHKMGFIIEGRPSGQGMLDIPWLLERMSYYKRNPSAILELWTPPEVNVEKTIRKEEKWARESVQYMHSLLKGCC
jgi:3-oxoisoapionate decarboxylase